MVVAVMTEVFRLSLHFVANLVYTFTQCHHAVVDWFVNISEKLSPSTFKAK